MDRTATWSKLYITKLNPQTANIVIQTDGGRRSEHCAAASIIVGVFGKLDGTIVDEPWYAEGMYIPVDVTVFQSEMIALDRALAWLVHEVEQYRLDHQGS
eukprot:9151766-Pyramimonas_sp.AAC.1